MLSSNLDNNEDKKVAKMQLLLEDPNQKQYLDFAKDMSPNSLLEKRKEEVGVKLVKDRYTEEYSKAFTGDEIRKEAAKYNLAFTNAGHFTGEYSQDFLRKLKDFIDAKKLTVSADDLSRRVYTLAPAQSDVAGVKTVDGVTDPLCFFMMDGKDHNNRGDYFILLDGEKNYVNMINLWKGFKNYNQSNCRVAYMAENLVILLVLFFGAKLFWGFTLGTGASWLTAIGIVALTIIGHFIRMGLRNSHTSDCDHNSAYFNEGKYHLE